ncbi:D-sedoheptulose 7-phosphate isomerase [Pedobacter petrophilus]|uniref:Phosphoheptose isomerase n=1 Tax=Pedobacter petrophilus TaxID=1908241 RepID=A0A7K0G440_9SPHI|nr:D-sedoheptulose 7-phosphate isomerase [Pedobacter petrophilus]MRX78200.1 D-sedoheptulose 7-phosphate isomerase [Pedobacter petrophilus]
MEEVIKFIFAEHKEVIDRSEIQLTQKIQRASELIISQLKKGKKILLFGNGGSAGDAQHIAAEFTGRFLKERRSLPAIALTTDTSALTAIGNDYGYDRVFERQVEGLASEGDVLIGISTSGNSTNVLKAFERGKEKGCYIIGLSGRDGGAMNELSDLNMVVPSDVTARIQEVHILIGHMICTAVDNNFD